MPVPADVINPGGFQVPGLAIGGGGVNNATTVMPGQPIKGATDYNAQNAVPPHTHTPTPQDPNVWPRANVTFPQVTQQQIKQNPSSKKPGFWPQNPGLLLES